MFVNDFGMKVLKSKDITGLQDIYKKGRLKIISYNQVQTVMNQKSIILFKELFKAMTVESFMGGSSCWLVTVV